jgi:hypothetical protein
MMSHKNHKTGIMFRNTKRIQFLIAGLLLLQALPGFAQNDALSRMHQLRETYRAKPWISFDVKYTYAAETAPTVITDSSMGNFKINGNHYWCRIDSMEFMQNDSFMVAVYAPEKIMSLSLPSPLYPGITPFANWDSLYQLASLFTTAHSVDAGYKKMTITFNNPIPYKKTEIWYDSTAMLIQKVRYTIHEESITGDYSQSTVNGPYVVVSMLFQNYQYNAFGASVFYSTNYFGMDGPGNYILNTAYADFVLYKTAGGL